MSAYSLPARRFLASILHPSARALAAILLFAAAGLFFSPGALRAQSVSFAGTQTSLPFSGGPTLYGIAVVSAGDVFLADTDHSRVVELPKTAMGYGPQTTVTDAVTQPHGIAVDRVGNVLILDPDNTDVAALQTQSVDFGGVNICPAGQTTPAPCSETLTLSFTVAASGTLGTPKALTLGAPNLDFTVASGSTCTGEVTEGSTCTVNVTFAPRFAGLRRGGVEVVDGSGNVLADVPVYGTGSGPQVTFHPGTLHTLPSGLDGIGNLAVDGSGNVFAGDGAGLQEILAAGGYTTVKTVGAGASGIAIDGSGNLFVTGVVGNGNGVLELLADGGYTTVQTVASGLYSPWGVAVDGSENVFIADYFQGHVDEILAAGGYTTIKTLVSGIGQLTGVAVDGSGNVFVGNEGDGVLREIVAAGGYTTVRNLLHSVYAQDLAVDGSGNVFVADIAHQNVREVLAAEGYTTFKILMDAPHSSFVTSVAVDDGGNVFVGFYYGADLRKLDYADPPSVVFPRATAVGTEDTADGAQTVSVWNSGNQPLLFSTLDGQNNPGYYGDFHENTADDRLCASALEVAPGASCDVSINFLPSAEGVNTGRVVLADNALNGSPAKQTILLSGTGVSPAPGAEVSPNPLEFGAVAFGSSKTLPLTITNTGGSTLTIAPSGNGPSFTIQSSTCAAGVAAGGSCVLQVQYSPASFGVHGDFLTLTTNGTSNPVVKLAGQTIGVGVTSAMLNFGTIPLHTIATLPLTVTSYGVTGTVPITLSVDGNSYTVPAAGNTCLSGVGSGESCSLQVQFSPTSVGPHQHHLVVTSSYGTISVLLKGSGATEYDAAAQFSTTANPNGSWSYGWSESRGSAFRLDTHSEVQGGLFFWYTNSGPNVAHNGTDAPITSAGTVIIPAGAIDVHPGPQGQNTVVRWTAPAAGNYTVQATFRGDDFVGPTTTDVAILHNDLQLYASNVDGYGPSSAQSYSGTVSVLAGDTIDFTVGFGTNGNYYYDSTELNAKIALDD